MKNLLAALCAVWLLADAANAIAQDKPAVPAANSTQTMISHGAEPRRELRYKFSEEVQRVALEVRIEIETELDTLSMKQDLPPVYQSLEIVPTSVKDGILNFRGAFSEMTTQGGAALDPTTVASMNQLAHGLIGKTGVGKVSQRGVVSDANGTPNGTHLTSPLPLEAVGIGAQWRVTHPAFLNGVVADNNSTYTILSIEDDLVKVSVETETAAGKQVMENGSLPPGTSLIVDSIKGGSKGTITYDLKSMCPLSIIETKLVQDGSMIIAGQPDKKISVTIDFTLAVRKQE